MPQYDIRIYLGGDLANLYELGWISADFSQLIDFSRLLEIENTERAEKYFGEKARPFNRYTNISDLKERRPQIVDVRRGSIELFLAGASVTAAVIMPLVQIAVQQHFQAANETVEFAVDSQDTTLQQLLDDYQAGNFGRGDNALETLFYLLEQRNYDVQVLSRNVYLVSHTISKYSQRIVRTIRRNM